MKQTQDFFFIIYSTNVDVGWSSFIHDAGVWQSSDNLFYLPSLQSWRRHRGLYCSISFFFYLAGLVMMNDPFVSFARARTSITHSSRSSSKAVWNLEVPCHQCSVSARHTQKESGGSPIVLRDLYRPKSTHYNQARTVRRQEHARENGHKKMGGSVLTDDIRPLFLLSRGWLNKSIISSSLFDWL